MYPKTQQQINDFLAEGIFPGANYAFIRGNKIIRESHGYRQILPSKKELTFNTLFDVASLTKVIGTNSVILKMWEDRVIDLDQPLQTYLTTFADSQVTIRHLLTHTSGINPFIENRDQLNRQELRSALLQLKAGATIGEEVVYTDTGTLLLGFLIEEIYQQPVQTVITSEVLQPLGMTDSTFEVQTENVAATENHPRREVICGEVHDPKASVLKENCGSAGLFSSLNDCIIFCQMILNQGQTASGEHFLKAETIQRLTEDHTPTKQLKRSLGWDLKQSLNEQNPLLFHTGYTGTFLLIDLAHKEAFVFLSNRVHPDDQRLLYLNKRDQLLQTYLNEKNIYA